jgi:hypothetical protein
LASDHQATEKKNTRTFISNSYTKLKNKITIKLEYTK